MDAFRARILCSENWEQEARELGFEIDKKISGYHSLWVKAMEPQNECDSVTEVSISGEGLSNVGERRQRKIKCGEQQISVGPTEKIIIVFKSDENAIDPATSEAIPLVPRRVPKLDTYGEPVLQSIETPAGIANRWLISEASISVVDTYFTTVKPDTSKVGVAYASTGDFVMLNPPDLPEYVWSPYSGKMRLFCPQGWILADRDVDQLFYFSDTIGLWRVTDTSIFRNPGIPD